MPRRFDRRLAFLLIASLFAPQAVTAATLLQDPQPRDVTEIDLDDLLKIKVTSAAKKEQPLTEAASAIYVIRSEDIRRTGATSIPEALRQAPGVHVARNTANAWAVSARGFNDPLANKMLVLVDGRSVYTPIHSGVYWDVQDTLLEDLDRIEVIRGPGGTLWGANAINGVINVISKRAEETQGGLVTAGGGTEERAWGEARYGFKAADDLYVRVYGKYRLHDDAANGLDPTMKAHDGGSIARGGFRADWILGDRERVTVSGDYYEGHEREQLVNPDQTPLLDQVNIRGGNLVARWEKSQGVDSSMSVQFYYDYTSRIETLFTELLHTVDLEFQHRFSPLDGHDIIWGLGGRLYRSGTRGSLALSITPADNLESILNAFVQDEITLVDKHLKLILGSKGEWNTLSGWDWQPSGRLAWIPDEDIMFWASVSRAVRTPCIIDEKGRLNPVVLGTPPVLMFSIFGSPSFNSEVLVAYEAGWRVRPVEPLSFDVAAFYNSYDRLRSGVVGAPFVEANPAPPHTVIPITIANGVEGNTWGVEVAGNLQVMAGWLIQASWTYLSMHISDPTTNGQSPTNQVFIHSAMDLPGNVTFDAMIRYVSALANFGVNPYWEWDARLAWHDDARRVEAAVVGQNLMNTTHAEFQAAGRRSEIQRGIYASLTLRF